MTSLLAHGGTGGLIAELSLLSLPLVGVAVLWWWNRRLTRQQAAEGVTPDGQPSTVERTDGEVEP